VPKIPPYAQRVAEAKAQEAQDKAEASILTRMVAADREIRKSANTPKRRMPKVTRYESPRMRTIMQQTKNPVRATFQTAEQALRGHEADKTDEKSHTRDVGPMDFGHNYCHGKETESR
jgi:hypothetical protein